MISQLGTLGSKLEQVIGDIGKGYDFWMVLMFLPLPFVNRNRQPLLSRGEVFCSEEVFAREQDAGAQLFKRVKAFQVSPSMLALSPRLVLERTAMTHAHEVMSADYGNKE